MSNKISGMITAEKARKNNTESVDKNIGHQLETIIDGIEDESTNGTNVDWIVVKEITDDNIRILEHKGFQVNMISSGASKFSWKVKW